MKRVFTILFSMVLLNTFAVNNFWQKISTKNLTVPGVQKIIPQKTNLVKLDDAAFRAFQQSIPTEESGNFVLLDLPMPDGSLKTFKVFERTCMEPELAAKYPELKTYEAIALNDAFVTAKLDYTVYGFHAMIFNQEGISFIDPYSNANTGYYNSYYKKDYQRPAGQTYPTCQTPSKTPESSSNFAPVSTDDNPTANRTDVVTDGKIRTFRLALACTVEYSAAVCAPQSPTKQLVMAAMVTSLNRVNGVYEKDLAIHMNLVAKDDTLIFINSDSYTNDDGGAMLSQNTTVCNNRIGSANYDIGHVFSTGGGGIAGLGVVCTSSKAEGVTGSDNPVGDGFDIDYVAHEMGHQYGANHTFNATTGSCSGNRESTAAYEPGSATTIMGYAGICDANDIQLHSDDYFHRVSINEIFTYISGTTCGVLTNSGNTTPTVNSYTSTFYVPYKTSFEITAGASDANSDPIKYCWEEYDLGPSGNWNAANNTKAPIFRSFNPTTSGTRVFPTWDSLIVNSIKYRGEVLPEVTRDVKFRCTVRDQHNGYGAFNAPDADLTVKAVTTTSLFRVNSQLTATTITGNTTQNIDWDVAQTTDVPISCSTVDIYLSLDSARTFPYTLASNVANDGSETVTIPDVFTTNFSARIKVKGHGNIFFDLNNGWIKINKGVASVAASFTASDTMVCVGSSLTFTNTSTGSPDSVRWTINGGTPSTSNSTSTVTAAFNTAGTYNVNLVAYKAGVGSPIFFRTIHVNALPTINFAPTTPVTCAGDSITIVANFPVGSTSSWSTGASGNSIKVAPNSNTYYSLTVTNTAGCTKKDSVLVKVNPKKTTSFSQTICSDDSVVVGGQVFKTSGLHTVVLQTSLSCDSTVNLTLTVNPVKTTNLSQTICQGESASAGGQSFTTNGIHTVVLQTSKGCDSIVNLTLTVNPKPNVTATVTPLEICASTSATLSGGGALTYTWSGGLASGQTVTTPNLNTTTTYSVYGVDANGCKDTTDIIVTVNPLPATATLILRNDSLVATGSTGVQYKWYLNNAFQANTNVPNFKPTAQGSWTVVVVSSDGCSSATSGAFVITGIRNHVSELLFDILPNPAREQFEIHLSSNKSAKYDLSIYNITGQVIAKESFNAPQGLTVKHYSTDNWDKGVYFISLISDEGTAVKNLVIQ